ncbi:MAG: flagellar motor switch protein FliM [Arthrobacter sp.]
MSSQSSKPRSTDRTKEPEVYDFRRPTTLAREHSRVLELAFETFARQWGTQLTAKIRTKVQVVSETVLMQTYDEYAASLPATTAMVLCAVEDKEARAVIQFPTSAALSWVGHMLGGNGSAEAPDRKFTQIEQALVRRLMDEALEDLVYSLGTLLDEEIKFDSLHYNSQFAQAAQTADLMIVALFTITVGEVPRRASVAIPAEILLSKLGAANPTEDPANARELIVDQVARTPVDIALQLTPASVRPRTILNLAVGDLLNLPHPQHKPFDVTVDSRRLARASVGTNGSRLAAVITTIEENNS